MTEGYIRSAQLDDAVVVGRNSDGVLKVRIIVEIEQGFDEPTVQKNTSGFGKSILQTSAPALSYLTEVVDRKVNDFLKAEGERPDAAE